VAVAPAPPTKQLRDLVGDVASAEVRGELATPVSGIAYRSDETEPGDLFFCVPGERRDGHDFAADAVGLGAAALVVERWLPLSVPQVRVPSVREAMGPVSAAFHDHAADRMTLVGVTGTSGKTTVTYLLEAVFRAAGWVPGVIGTTGVRLDGRPMPLARTTPEAPDLHGLLADMAGAGVGAVAMEVSSHGLDQRRVGGLHFAVAVFTNLSLDHLDYHGSMAEYLAAKALLFTPELADRAVVNHDSPEGRALAGRIPTLSYGIGAGADVRASEVETTPRGLDFRVDGLTVRSSLQGLFNVENCLAAIATARTLGVDDRVAAEAIASVPGVPGRLEPVDAGQGFLVIVDYAHKPDGVENVLRTARPLASSSAAAGIATGASGR
jgi:UDP-N-acetylmuramoyl-L-alanyl-D-glutamate--2,6-diaminopimelate ligase